jgi:hypothetical protein
MIWALHVGRARPGIEPWRNAIGVDCDDHKMNTDVPLWELIVWSAGGAVIQFFLVPYVWTLSRAAGEDYYLRLRSRAIFPESAMRGMLRATPVFGTCFFLCAVCSSAGLFLSNHRVKGTHPTAAEASLMLAGLGFLALMVLGFTVIWLYNWPKFLVAPAFRSDLGALQFKTSRPGRPRSKGRSRGGMHREDGPDR